MNARKAINAAVINGALLVAGMIGLLTGSFSAFLVVVLVLIAGAAYCGDVR